jgi:L-threonylcarbamoyladenylate synthase
MMKVSRDQAISLLLRGGCLVYPTETFYALGASATSLQALERICQIKLRPKDKPLPLILGSWKQLLQITECISPDLELLADVFWPGPLSILVSVQEFLPIHHLKDREGRVCVRWTSHPVAAQLCRDCGAPLVATSANMSGLPAVTSAEHLDPELICSVDGVLDLPPRPEGYLPSTIVRIVAPGVIRIVRSGAVPWESFQRLGFFLEKDELAEKR